jgi:cytoplasmic iron level regulating protein YaaA (DUF328/UPF0246 family)
MITILSPAKIMDFKNPSPLPDYSQPEFLKEAGRLIKLMQNLDMSELSKLLDINSNLTQLNFDRIFNWHQPFTLANSKQAAYVFDGEAYRGLDAKTLTKEDMDFAQQHLRLLSGLYGILRPLDLIQAYRLEVSTKLNNPAGKDLYAFWQEKVTKSILRALKESGETQVLLNLASNEYFKTLRAASFKSKVVDVEFYEYKNDQFKQIVIYTKKARGMMARYVIENRINQLEDLKGFHADGYWYNPAMSTDNKLVFAR